MAGLSREGDETVSRVRYECNGHCELEMQPQ